MSGAQLPYHLRPHKTVDRRLFLDLLSRYERWKPLVRYAYISMGAYPLEDHRLVHRLFGIKRLIAFDNDEETVKRQNFNRPCDTCRCFKRKSGELIDELDRIVREAEADDAEGLLIWLDYTSPATLGEQIREFQTLLDKVGPGDVVRVTVNAHLSALGDAREDGVQLDAQTVREKRFARLRERIGEYLPSAASASDMAEHRLPALIAQAFGRAAAAALPVTGPTMFAPLSVIRYADGQQMVSMTGSVVERQLHAEMRAKMELESWPFASHEWGNVHALSVPDRTMRERMFLERAVLRRSPEDLAGELGFGFGKHVNVIEFLKNYKEYYRFYPSMLTMDV